LASLTPDNQEKQRYQHYLPDIPYVSLEDPDQRQFALTDPQRFLLTACVPHYLKHWSSMNFENHNIIMKNHPTFIFDKTVSILKCDVIIEKANKLMPIEIKSGHTIRLTFFTI